LLPAIRLSCDEVTVVGEPCMNRAALRRTWWLGKVPFTKHGNLNSLSMNSRSSYRPFLDGGLVQFDCSKEDLIHSVYQELDDASSNMVVRFGDPRHFARISGQETSE